LSRSWKLIRQASAMTRQAQANKRKATTLSSLI